MNEFVLIHGQVVTPEKIYKADVLVRDGAIVKIGENIGDSFEGKKYDLNGKYILPGLIDVHVHFRTPGLTQKEDWETGSKAALAGGVTTVLDMPNTVPPTTNQKTLDEKKMMVGEKSLVNYGFYLGATKENLAEIKNIKNVAGVKIYMGSSTGNLLVDDKEHLEKFMAESGKLLAIHAETESCILEGMKNHPDHHDPKVHSLIRSPECAEEAVSMALELSKKYNSRVHVCHASTKKELDVVRKFKNASKLENQMKKNESHDEKDNSRVSVEVTPHHLFLNDTDYERYGNLIKVNPPLRSAQDQEALWQGIRDGLIDMVATDHAPHLMEEKRQEYDKVPSGVPGVQTMLPLLLNAVNEGKLSLEKVVELTSANPAKLFGMKGKGEIAVGMDADFAIVDMNLLEEVCHHYLWTKAHWSPFHGWFLKGWPVMTFVNGELMYEWRETFGKTLGKELQFS